MCLNPECRWITIVEDDKSGEKCYIHYKFGDDGTFEELFTEGDKSLKIYVEVMRDRKYFEPKDYPRVEAPHFNNICINGTYDTRGHNGQPDPNMYYPDEPKKVYNYPNQIAHSLFVMDYAGNILNIEEMNKPIELDIIDLDNQEANLVDYSKVKNPSYKSSNGY
jgi:hypothetical protein